MHKILNFKKGFTLIELLVVIAVIGILSAALLAGIDPGEQIKKGQDTAKRNMVTEYQNALLRYYSIQNAWPCSTALPNEESLSGAATCTTDLISAGELKANFSAVAGTANLSKMFVTISSSDNTSAVCFIPDSKSFRKDPTTVFKIDGTTDSSGCPGAGGTCYICSSSRQS